MADKFSPPFGTYASVTGVVDATAQTEITTLITELKTRLGEFNALVPPGSGVKQPTPDVERIHPDQARALTAEIDGVAAAIAAAPAS